MNTEQTHNPQPELLLVDDDEIYCEVLADALKKRNYSVSIAHNLADALQLANRIEPEYAVVDLRIGTESGLELVKKLSELDENTRIIMLTGYASVATAVESIKLGAVHYLTKPATADEVVAALHRDEGDSSVTPSEQPLSVRRLEWETCRRCLPNTTAISPPPRAHCEGITKAARRRPLYTAAVTRAQNSQE